MRCAFEAVRREPSATNTGCPIARGVDGISERDGFSRRREYGGLMPKARGLLRLTPDVGVVLRPTDGLHRAELAIAAATLASIVLLARVLSMFDAPSEAGGALFMLAGASYAVRLSSTLLWPPCAPALGSWQMAAAMLSASLITVVFAIALFAVGAGEAEVKLVFVGCLAYVDAVLLRSLFAHAPPVIRAARPWIWCLVAAYLAASALIALNGAPSRTNAPYLAGLDIALLCGSIAMVKAWASVSQRRRGAAVVAHVGLAISCAAATVTAATRIVSPDLYALVLAGFLVGLFTVVIASIGVRSARVG